MGVSNEKRCNVWNLQSYNLGRGLAQHILAVRARFGTVVILMSKGVINIICENNI